MLAPMAGVTDRPFRSICRLYGAALAFSEMVTSNPDLQHDRKTRLRCDHRGEPEPRAIQILGAEPRHMAAAARLNVDRGAQIIDINMGCPAKKVCNVAAGSALLKDERLVSRILHEVVSAVDVPVTLKIRTGWDTANRNAVAIAKIAESCGIQALTVHGRTRACGFSGPVEYHTIRQVKAAVGIPVVANGDIDSPEKARQVLALTEADALMIGRAALGRPWLFTQVASHLGGGPARDEPTAAERRELMLAHLHDLHVFYGGLPGVRIARKHIGWYAQHWPGIAPASLKPIYAEESPERQIQLARQLFDPEFRKLAA
ncbi:MAG: dusB [Proteobacteria bacterium]|nr:dusB [Pseudomonadota bacterium]